MGFLNNKFNSSAQGTIEYLVIIAVVVVISLIVVGLFVNMTTSPSQQITDSSDELGTSTSGGISVVESVIDSAGDSLIRLNNNSSDAITLTKISVGGVDNDFSEQLVGLDSKVFSLSNLSSGCVCASGQKTVKCEYIITYLQNGITKTDRLNKSIECVNDSTPVDPGKVVGLGSGTLTDPWIINNCQELQDVNQHLDGNYILGADINCYETRNWNNGAGFVPIEGPIAYCVQSQCPGEAWCDDEDYCEQCSLNAYPCEEGGDGTWVVPAVNFNGNNYVISNLTINLPAVDYVGIFAHTTSNISNVGLVDVNIIGANYVGGLVGSSEGEINNSYVAGKVSGSSRVGGLVGDGYLISNSYSTANVIGSSNYVGGLSGSVVSIFNCYSIGDVVSSASMVGGLAGSTGGEVSYSYSTGDVNGVERVGGLIGNNSGQINFSYSSGNVTGLSSSVGGLSGLSAGKISNCYSTGNVIGSGDYVGGLVGFTPSDISNCYSTGNVIGFANDVGGLVGRLHLLARVFNSYSTGSVTGAGLNVGGFVGKKAWTISNCGWWTGAAANAIGSPVGSVTYNEASKSAFYSSDHNVYDTTTPYWAFGVDANWETTATYPIFSWQ